MWLVPYPSVSLHFKSAEGGYSCQFWQVVELPFYQPKIKNMSHNLVHKLSAEAIKDFKDLYKNEFGEDLTDDEAEEIALRVIKFFYILEYGKNGK